MLSEEQIAAAIERADRRSGRPRRGLVDGANAEGGDDNITVVLFEIVEGEPEPLEARGPCWRGRRHPTTDGAGAGLQPDAPQAEPDRDKPRTHGAGPGGRLAAILFILAVLVVAALVLYWGITR